MRYVKRIAALVLCAAMLSGCTILNSGDDLLQLPKAPKSYLLLQNKLNELEETMTAISPQSGQYRDSVTFEDLDGDGTDEAIATMCSKKNGTVQVFVFKRVEDEYVQIGCISGQGSAIGSLSFPYFTSDQTEKGMIITWNLSDSLEQGMTVCALQDGEMQSLRDLEYTDYTTCDLDGDNADELFLVNYTENGNTASLYNYSEHGDLELVSQADATQDIQTSVNITMGMLASGENAVFVDNKYETDNGMQTDIYVVGDKLENLALTTDITTYRSVSLYYSDDVNSDGYIEVPQLTEIPELTRSETEDADSQVGSSWYIDWYQFGTDKEEKSKKVATTYTSLSEEWMLFLPAGWRDNVSVKNASDSGISQTLFMDAKTRDVLLTIYVFNEKDRDQLFRTVDLTDLGESNSRCYAMRVETTDNEYAMTETQAERRFTKVHPDWY
jgi:hypothetical protein